MYRIEVSTSEGKSTYQPQVINTDGYFENLVKLGEEVVIGNSQNWETKEMAVSIIDLYKKQLLKPKAVISYIDVE